MGDVGKKCIHDEIQLAIHVSHNDSLLIRLMRWMNVLVLYESYIKIICVLVKHELLHI